MNYIRIHLVRANNHQYPFPKYKNIESAMLHAFWNSAHSAADFILGGLLFYGRSYYQHWTHSMLAQPIQQRIEEPVTQAQHSRNMNLLKKIILNDEWCRQGTTCFFDNCIPSTIQKLQQLLTENHNDFSMVQECVAHSGGALSRSKLTAYFYLAITQNSNPTAVINMLTDNQITPKNGLN